MIFQKGDKLKETRVLGLLNMSSMRLVTRKPPKMLMLEMKAALAAKAWAVFDGTKPPPICRR